MAALAAPFARNHVRQSALEYSGLRGEGSIPVPLPPPPRRGRIFSAKLLSDLSPIAAAISHLNSGLLLGSERSLFSERPISLQSSGLRRFGTVFEIPTFRRTSEFQRKEVLPLLSDGREELIPIRNIEVRVLSPQPAFRGLAMLPTKRSNGPETAGFCVSDSVFKFPVHQT